MKVNGVHYCSIQPTADATAVDIIGSNKKPEVKILFLFTSSTIGHLFTPASIPAIN